MPLRKPQLKTFKGLRHYYYLFCEISSCSFFFNSDPPGNSPEALATDFYDDRLGNKYKGKYSWGEGRNKGTNFLTLIEFYVFYKLREQKISSYQI